MSEIPHPRNLEPGQKVDRWTIVDRIGCGAYGIVFQVTDGEGSFALKMGQFPPSQRSIEEDLDARAQREAAILMGHGGMHGLPRVFATGRWPNSSGYPYIVMDHIQGGMHFDEWCRSCHPTATDIVNVFKQIAETLKLLHDSKIVHRDLKPNNILIVPNDGTWKVYILDFGIARFPGSVRLTRGAPSVHILVCPPELCRYIAARTHLTGQPYVSKWQEDMWAVGVLLYYALTGHYPYWQALAEGDYTAIEKILREPPLPVKSLNGGAPLMLARLAERLLDVVPEYRATTTGQLLDDLDSAWMCRYLPRWNEPVLPVEARQGTPLVPVEDTEPSVAHSTVPSDEGEFVRPADDVLIVEAARLDRSLARALTEKGKAGGTLPANVVRFPGPLSAQAPAAPEEAPPEAPVSDTAPPEATETAIVCSPRPETVSAPPATVGPTGGKARIAGYVLLAAVIVLVATSMAGAVKTSSAPLTQTPSGAGIETGLSMQLTPWRSLVLVLCSAVGLNCASVPRPPEFGTACPKDVAADMYALGWRVGAEYIVAPIAKGGRVGDGTVSMTDGELTARVIRIWSGSEGRTPPIGTTLYGYVYRNPAIAGDKHGAAFFWFTKAVLPDNSTVRVCLAAGSADGRSVYVKYLSGDTYGVPDELLGTVVGFW